MKTTLNLLIFFFFLSSTSSALDLTWTGATSHSWSDSSNFSPMVVPGSGDTVTIDTTAYHPILSGNVSIYHLNMFGDTLDLNGYQMETTGAGFFSGGVLIGGHLKCSGTVAEFSGTQIMATINAQCSGILLNGSEFHETVFLEINGSESSAGTGVNTFFASVTLKNSGTTGFRLATTGGDTFKDSLTLINTSTRDLQVSVSDTSYFQKVVTMENHSTGVIHFGRSGGVSILEQGGMLEVNSAQFSSGTLMLNQIVQENTLNQRLELDLSGLPSDHAMLLVTDCRFKGEVDFTSPSLLIKGNRFEGLTMLTKTGGSHDHSDGGNDFVGQAMLTNLSTTGNMRLGNSSSDYFREDVTITSGNHHVFAGYKKDAYFYKDVTIDSLTTVVILATLAGTVDQELKGASPHQYNNLTLDKPTGKAIAQTPVEIINNMRFRSGHLQTDSTNLITFLAGAEAHDASNASFVSGPVKKVGNTAFEFPVGKEGHYGGIGISAPDSLNDSFCSEYFLESQTVTFYIDSTIQNLCYNTYWVLNKLNGYTDSVDVELTWDKKVLNVGLDSNMLKIAYVVDTFWTTLSSNILATDSLRLGLSSIGKVQSFGYFSIANGSSGGFNSGIVTINKNVQIWGASNNHEHGNCQVSVVAPTLVLHNSNSIGNNPYCTGVTNILNETRELSMGFNQSLTLQCDQTLRGWGVNRTHQLGNPESSINNVSPYASWAAVPVIEGTSINDPFLSNITAVSSGPFASLAINEDGRVHYWGALISDVAYSSTQVPTGSGSSVPVIQQLFQNGPDLENVIAIACGGYHFLALLNDGTVMAWGRNANGQLGTGGTNPVFGERFPKQVMLNGQMPLTGIKAIAAGERHSVALDINGNVYCWGSNQYGQLGDGSFNDAIFATLNNNLSNIEGISAGIGHTIAFQSSNIWGFGNNFWNQLGQASGGGSETLPVQVTMPSGLNEINNITCGEKHTLVISKDAKIFGMGSSENTQLAIYPSNLPTSNIPLYSTPLIELSNQNSALPLEAPYVTCDQGVNYCYYNFEISITTTWTTTNHPICYQQNVILIENELLIRRGCTLTVNPGITLMFGPNGRIVLEEGDGVDDGAVLRLNNNVTLTAAGYCMWKGVEVRGNSAFTASNTRQAQLIIDTGVLFEHAHNAITLGKWDEAYYACYESYPIVYSSGFDLTGSGGQLQCDQATFQHNAIDIRFAPFQRISSSFIIESHFLGGELRDSRYVSGTSNNPFYAPPNPLQRAHNAVNQWQARVIQIEDNDFDDYEAALHYTDSRLKVIDNTFSNCRIGINTLTTGAVLVYGGQVEENSFTDVRTQIRASGGKYLQVTNENHFNNTFPFGTQQDNYFGIYMNQERAFRISDNYFTRLRYGIVSTNSGFSGGQINYLGQGNLFTECWRSIHLQQNHRNLRIKCNNYDNQTGTQYNSNWYMISNVTLSDQGWPSMTSEQTQAGNRFLQSPDFNELTSLSQIPFTYFRHSSPDEVIPSPAGSGIINIDANSIAMSDFDDACEPVVVPPGGEPDRLAYFTGVLDSLSLEMDTLMGSLDNNHTDSLLNIIHPMYAQDTIMNRLTGNLPLSDTVLIKAINSPDALNDSTLYEVLFKNSPYSNEVLEALNERDPEFSEELRYELNQVQGLNSPHITVTGIQKEIYYYQTENQLLINDYVSRLVADDSTFKAIQVLESKNNYEDLQTIFGTYLVVSELDSAQVKFEALMNHSEAEVDWLELNEIHLNLASETKSWFDMDSTQEVAIRNIATQEENTLAKVQAQNVIHLVYRDTFPDYIDEDEYYLRQQQPVDNLTVLKNKKVLNQLTVIPNPANDFITVEFNGSKQKSCYLEIIDITGKRHYYSKVEFKQNTYDVDVSFLNSGLYLLRVTDNMGFNENSKLMIAR